MKLLNQLFGFLVVFGLTTALVQASAIHINTLVDPQVTATNLSGNSIELTWQTTVENTALSPARGMKIDAGAENIVADKGLFWFINKGSDQKIKNVVYVSVVGEDGMFVSQTRLDDKISSQLETAEKTGIHIVVNADGSLALAATTE